MRRRLALAAVIAAATMTRLRRWFPVRVAGDSMLPALRRGDLLAVRALRPGEPRLGQLVVARQSGREVVKRVVRVPGEGEPPSEGFWLEGDNAARSSDSRTAGPVLREELSGVVQARYWPLRRIRRL